MNSNFFRSGMITLAASAFVMLAANEAFSGPPTGTNQHKTGTTISSNKTIHVINNTTTTKGITLLNKNTPIVNLSNLSNKTSTLHIDTFKKSPISLVNKGDLTYKSTCKPICPPFCNPCWKKCCWHWCGCWNPCFACYGFVSGCCNVAVTPPAAVDAVVPPAPPADATVTNPGATIDTTSGDANAETKTATDKAPQLQNKRFLKLKNDTAEKLQVSVQYIVRGEDGKETWLPGEPGSENAVSLTLEPGQEVFVENNGERIATRAVRVWAVSDKNRYMEFQGQDLVLVPEVDGNGQHGYPAEEVKTFSFVFPKAD